MTDGGEAAREIDFDDVQGLVRFGHGHLPESCFLLLRVRDAAAARSWLRTAPITTSAYREAPPSRAMQVAFTAEGLLALELHASIVNAFSEEFVTGMAADPNRSRRLGDVSTNDPSHWRWGSGMAAPHLALLLYARAGELQSWQSELQDAVIDAGFDIVTGLPSRLDSSREHFGFIDGISQPDIDWEGRVKTGPHERDRYSNDLARGEILLGYANEYGLHTDRPLLDMHEWPAAAALPEAREEPKLRDLGRNGSYLVLRQLSQDVAAFWQFIDGAVAGNAIERERLAAAFVGRERSDGRPLVPASGLNRFTFDDDPLGRACPIGAHVRRANPRTGDFPPGVTGFLSRMVRTLGFRRRHPRDDLVASTRFHRLLRRGRIYGDDLPLEDALAAEPGDDERGLHFVCLGANIARQFEFVQNAWIHSASFAGLHGEADPLLGNREPLAGGVATDNFTQPTPGGPARCVGGLPRFVRVLGGAYFFLPGIQALRFICRDGS